MRRQKAAAPYAERYQLIVIDSNSKYLQRTISCSSNQRQMHMPKKKAGNAGRNIDSYQHDDKDRVNNPPVGLVTPDTDKDIRGFRGWGRT